MINSAISIASFRIPYLWKVKAQSAAARSWTPDEEICCIASCVNFVSRAAAACLAMAATVRSCSELVIIDEANFNLARRSSDVLVVALVRTATDDSTTCAEFLAAMNSNETSTPAKARIKTIGRQAKPSFGAFDSPDALGGGTGPVWAPVTVSTAVLKWFAC